MLTRKDPSYGLSSNLDAALLETWYVFRRAGAVYIITYGDRPEDWACNLGNNGRRAPEVPSAARRLAVRKGRVVSVHRADAGHVALREGSTTASRLLTNSTS